MKKIILAIIIVASSSIIAKSQIEIQWQKCLGGSDEESGCSVRQTFDGGYIVAGTSSSDDGNVSGVHGGEDIWIVKLDSDCNIQWQKCLGGSADEFAASVYQTPDGGYMVYGETSSNDFDISGNHGMEDIWVAKLDGTGNILWQHCYGGTYGDYASSFMPTSDGGYLFSGYTYSYDGDVTTTISGDDIWLVKINSTGSIIWQKCYGGTGFDWLPSVIQIMDGEYVLIATTASNNINVSGNHGGFDIWIAKLDSAGNILDQGCYGGSNNDIASTIIQTNDGGYIFSGITMSFNGNVTGNHGFDDIWIVKIDSTGIIQWTRCLGGTSSDQGASIVQTSAGDYLIIGSASSDNGDVCGNHGAWDTWLVRLSAAGNILWQKCIGGSYSDYSFLQITLNDGYILAGHTSSNNGDVSGNHGFGDLWIIKLVEQNISGIVFHDINENGIRDPGEQGVAGHLVRYDPGPEYTFTDNDGRYYFRGDTGVTNTVTYVPQQHWHTINVADYDVVLDSVSQIADTLDFAVKCRENVQDVSVYATGTTTRAYFQTYYWLTYKNSGSITANGTISFEYDPLLTYNSSTITPASHVGNILVYNYDTLGPGAQRQIRIDFQVPGIQNMGDSLFSNVFITPLVPDTNITNNYDTLYQVITGPVDPNDKKVAPAGYEQWGFVEHGQRLTYTIRFQNTGTDTAINVVLRDTLDTDLDIESFVVEASSHQVTWTLNNGNELYFRFQNIMLPDSNVNEPESHGFIRYSVSPKAGLADGTSATNTSYIFFDYNQAVVTNTTLNTFVTNIPVGETEDWVSGTNTLAFPNPSNDNVYINLPEYTRKVQVYNTNGEMVKEIMPQRPVAEINITELQKGVYAVRIYHVGGVVTTKFVKE